MRFEFMTANRIIFGSGTLAEIGKHWVGLGKHALVVRGSGGVDPTDLFKRLEACGVAYSSFQMDREPEVEDIRRGVDIARGSSCDFVIGFGGGSVLDSAKAIAALLSNDGDLFDFLEVIGRGKPLANQPAPVIAIPTTSGTGSEVTRNAVLASPEHQVKVSLRSPLMLPTLALIDPELTLSLPPDVTASTGMDALAQVLEPFVSIRGNPMVDGFCRQGLQKAAWGLKLAYRDGENLAAREAMALTSLLGGLSLANAGLGAVHGFAAPIGGMFKAPHGAVCAVLLPAVCAVNQKALIARQPENPTLNRYQEIAVILTGNANAQAEDGISWLEELRADLNIPPLGRYGLAREVFPELIEKAAAASSMQANPIKLTYAEMEEILERAV